MAGAKAYKSRWDGMSMMVSLLCMVHCVVLPLLVSFSPLFEMTGMEDPRVEWTTVLLTATIGGWAIWKGYKLHRRMHIVATFLAGLVLVIAANAAASQLVEMVGKTAGAMLIIVAHLRNLAEGRRCCALLPTRQ